MRNHCSQDPSHLELEQGRYRVFLFRFYVDHFPNDRPNRDLDRTNLLTLYVDVQVGSVLELIAAIGALIDTSLLHLAHFLALQEVGHIIDYRQPALHRCQPHLSLILFLNYSFCTLLLGAFEHAVNPTQISHFYSNLCLHDCHYYLATARQY